MHPHCTFIWTQANRDTANKQQLTSGVCSSACAMRNRWQASLAPAVQRLTRSQPRPHSAITCSCSRFNVRSDALRIRAPRAHHQFAGFLVCDRARLDNSLAQLARLSSIDNQNTVQWAAAHPPRCHQKSHPPAHTLSCKWHASYES